MTGAILQLAARGPQDAYLCNKSEITFFKTVYRRHTNFAIETVNECFENSVNFDSLLKYTVSRKGDLISNTLSVFIDGKNWVILERVAGIEPAP